MDSTTRRAALRAAAKLTWGGGWTMAVACGGATAGTHDEGAGGALAVAEQPATEKGGAPPGMTNGSGGVTATSGATATIGGSTSSSGATATAGTGPSTGGAGGQPDGGSAGAGGATASECTTPIAFQPDNVVTVSVPDDELACCVADVLERMEQPGAETDPSVVNCCTAIVLGSNSRSPHYASPVRQYCCAGGSVAEPSALYSLPYCTPWGPPVPPALPGAMA
jgi:hypothetical protein